MSVGINGFGRIGKTIFKLLLDQNIKVSLINDPKITVEYVIYSLQYDTVYGRDIKAVKKDNGIEVNGMYVEIQHHLNPSEINWRNFNVEIVVEASGCFNKQELALKHNVNNIICTGPSEDIKMIVYGVNENEIDMNLISAASCTTNCAVPILKVIDDKFKIKEGALNTIHAVTATQNTVDGFKTNFRAGRSMLNIIPSTTGATNAIEKILPQLKNKMKGVSMRVPVVDVSVLDLTISTEKGISSMDEVRKTIEESEMFRMGILSLTDDQVVSSDFIGERSSCVVDISASFLISENFIKLICWYDNEFGYSCRVIDLIKHISSRKK